MLAPWKKRCDKPRQNIKKQRHYFVDKGLYSQSYGFSNSHLQIWELDRKEGWVPKNWCFQIVVMEKTLESSLDSKEIKPANPKGNQSWIFIGRSDAEAEALILWPSVVKSWLFRKDPDAGKDWRQEQKGATEMVGWHHWQWTWKISGDSRGQRSLACYSPWGHRVRHWLVIDQQQTWQLTLYE